MSHNNKKIHGSAPRGQRQGLRLGEELLQLDEQLMELISRRTQLLAKAATRRREKNLPLAEPEQEKRLWNVWNKASRTNGLNPKIIKQLFVAANSLGYIHAEKRNASVDSFLLAPKSGPIHIDAAGPTSRWHTRHMMAIAAATGDACTMRPVIYCDPLIELAKAFNQVGASISWEENGLICRESGGLSFEGNLVFAGSSPRNLYLLLSLALAYPGRCRFSGGPELKLLNVSPIAKIMPTLGARLAPIDRKAPGLPARLEAGAPMEETITIDQDTPAGFAAALALAAWTFEDGLTILYTPGSPSAEGLEEAVSVLSSCGVDIDFEPGRLAIPSATPHVPEDIILPLDPLLAGTMLAMPRMRGGQTRLTGNFEDDSAKVENVLNMLRKSGLEVTINTGEVISRPGEWPGVYIPGVVDPEIYPLALAIACACPFGGELQVSNEEEILDSKAFLELCGREYGIEDNRIHIRPGQNHTWEEPLTAPTSAFALCTSLLSLSKPGLSITNPGILATLWPGYWSMFNRLPLVEETLSAPREIKDKSNEPKRRRIRVQ